jgi:hypothetical protein
VNILAKAILDDFQKPSNIIASLQTFPIFAALLHPSYMSFKNVALWYAFRKLWLRPELKVGFADD